MKWIVIEDKQTTITLIAVIGVPETRKHSAEHQACASFQNKSNALAHALHLKQKTQAGELRVFLPEGL